MTQTKQPPGNPGRFTLKEENHYDLIERYCEEHTTIAPMIAAAPAKFNPVRDCYALQKNMKDIAFEMKESPGPISSVQYEPYVPITDDYLISLLEPRYRSEDLVGYGQRARKLEHLFGRLTLIETVPLLIRLASRLRGDRVAMFFHGHLATATRVKLINILRVRLGMASTLSR